MKALSIKQPWACLTCEGIKTIEVRSWETDYRGELLICASGSPNNVWWTYEGAKLLMPAGGIIGVVELLDCRPFVKSDSDEAMSDWEKGKFAWVTKPKRWARPDRLVGKLGLFDVPDERIILLDKDEHKDWIFNYPPPQGARTYREGDPLLNDA